MSTEQKKSNYKLYCERHPERIRDIRSRSRKKNPLAALLADCKHRAKKRGLEFDLTVEDLVPLPTHCPILGLPLSFSTTGKKTDNSYSLDRQDNTKGYVRGNVCWISDRANRIKNDSTLDELISIAIFLAEQLSKS